MFLSPAPIPHMRRTHTTDGLYSLICLSAVQPTATEPKCSTFWEPSTSWSSGRFCLMLTSSWAHLAGAEMGESWGDTRQGLCGPANSPSKKISVPGKHWSATLRKAKKRQSLQGWGEGRKLCYYMGPTRARPGRMVG